MDPSTSKPKRGVRKFLRGEVDKLLGRSPSSAPALSIQSLSTTGFKAPSSMSSTGLARADSISGMSRPQAPAIVLPSHEGRQLRAGVWTGLEAALQSLHTSTKLFPPVQSAANAFLGCLDIMQEVSRSYQEYEDLASELASLAGLLAHHMSQSNSARMSGSVANIARSIEAQVTLIQSKRERGTGMRLLEASADEQEVGRCYRRIESLFRQLQADATLSIWNVINDRMANSRLEGLEPVRLANYNSKLSTSISRRTCTANTRTAILSELSDWSIRADAVDLYWMNGMAGTGKTTIACTFSEALDKRKQLAGSFFCTRTVPACKDASRIIPTIAYQLARYSIPFQSALSEALGEDPDISTKHITRQFDQLLKEQLLKVEEAISSNLVVVIDALDECDDAVEVELLLSLLLKSVSSIPLKFFVTSRPKPEIYGKMLGHGQGYHSVLYLHEVERSLVEADVELYLEAELEPMSPTPAQIRELARRSGNLFIYAATLVRYIMSRRPQADPQQRLQSVLSMTSEASKQNAEIDALYSAVLKAAFDDHDLEFREVENVRHVLHTVVCVQEPVSVEILAVLAGIGDERRTFAALQPLRAVIHLSDTSGLISTLHTSFIDFIFDDSRSRSFACSLAAYSEVLARHCFEVLKSQLRFNICKLESSFIPDGEVENLDDRVDQAISPVLFYACRYWANHLGHSAYSDSLCDTLHNFLSNRLLFWMEVLNLKRDISMGVDILLRAKRWLPFEGTLADIGRLVEDARDFVITFAANSVSRSTPHIYLSSLPFCPKPSAVLKQYQEKTTGLINVTGTAMQTREAAVLLLWKANSMVYSVAYSPNGKLIAFGCEDGTVTIRNAHNGTLVVGPLAGHTGYVGSIAFSPDGSHIASISGQTLRVCNVQDGKLIFSPLQSHTKSIFSVAYSPDGTRIVSSFSDDTIYIWNAHDGTPIMGPFQGERTISLSLAYSPDGNSIASGSNDNTIRIWSAHDGTLIVGPLRGHSDRVWSVTYSPDSACIVSGSGDGTLRVWNARDGALLIAPLEGHTDSVWTVDYSLDGANIVSGSADNTIRVWNAHDGTLIAGPLTGHDGLVFSVAFSPDGMHIVSGSSDDTVRVWNIRDRLQVRSSKGHTEPLVSIAYSPDGSRIASGALDHTIRVWDAYTGAPVTCLLDDMDDICTIAYSPDGAYIVSGYGGGTIRIWDARGTVVLTASRQGHTGDVYSITYSPDGAHIASGSGDATLRIWTVPDGTLVLGPLEGHTGPVMSVSYSPDGVHIVSGSVDHTIRMWNTHDGTLVAGPFEGHTDTVWSVSYSPDATCVVSGSSDCTVRVWSVNDGALILGPLEGHTNSVLSVVYSPDGTRIASGSYDNTICVWDAHNGALTIGPLQGHTSYLISVAYSPDGNRIISSSDDDTIRVWDVRENIPLLTVPVAERHRTIYVARDDGWVTNSKSELFLWVPHDLRSSIAYVLSSPRCLLAITPNGSVIIDDKNIFFGERWAQCYISGGR